MASSPVPAPHHSVSPYLVVEDVAALIAFLKKAVGATDLTKSLLYVYVADADATYAAAIKAGATSVMEPADQIYGDRAGAFKDPADNSWWVATHIEDVSEAELQRRTKEKFSAAAP